MSKNSKDGSYYRMKKIDSIAKKYMFLSRKEAYYKLCSGNSEKEQKRREFIKTVDQTLEEIDVFHRQFVVKEFFRLPSENKFWWTAIYSRSSYYRYRDESIRLFLNVFYEKYKNTYGFDFYDLNFN